MKKSTIHQLLESSNRATARQLDTQWQEAQKRQESKILGRLSHILISIQEVGKMWAHLQAGECLVLSSDGSIHKGNQVHVRKDKMTAMKERYVTDRVEYQLAKSDPETAAIQVPYKFSAHNNWDSKVREVNPDGSSKRAGRKAQPVLEADIV